MTTRRVILAAAVLAAGWVAGAYLAILALTVHEHHRRH